MVHGYTKGVECFVRQLYRPKHVFRLRSFYLSSFCVESLHQSSCWLEIGMADHIMFCTLKQPSACGACQDRPIWVMDGRKSEAAGDWHSMQSGGSIRKSHQASQVRCFTFKKGPLGAMWLQRSGCQVDEIRSSSMLTKSKQALEESANAFMSWSRATTLQPGQLTSTNNRWLSQQRYGRSVLQLRWDGPPEVLLS